MNDQKAKSDWLLVLAVISALGMWLAYNQLSYGDWTCGFKRCVAVRNIK